MMEALDRKILDLLSRDASLTAAAVAERVGLSPSAIHRRIKSLEDRGLIERYVARLSHVARGCPTTVFVSVTLRDQTQEVLVAFETAVRNCPDIVEAHLMSGDADYLLKAPVRADDNFERIHRVLAKLPGVQRLVSHFSIRPVVEPW